MSSTTVAIAGFTGKLAQLVTRSLLSKPDVAVHGIARTTSKVPQDIATNPRVKVFEADASPSSIDKIREAIRGCSIVICCYLGDDSVLVDGQKTLIDAAIAENVPRYLASDYSVDFRGFKMDDLPLKNFQLVVNDYLQQKEAEGLIKGVHVLNGAFMEIVTAPFMGIYDSEKKAINVWGSGDEVWEMTTYEDTARFVAEVAVDPTATGYLKCVGDSISTKQIQAAFKDVYGQDLPLNYCGSLEEVLAKGDSLKAKDPYAFFVYAGYLFTYYILGGATLINGDDRGRYGMSAMNFKDFLRLHEDEDISKVAGF